jgi:hypothetical protein
VSELLRAGGMARAMAGGVRDQTSGQANRPRSRRSNREYALLTSCSTILPVDGDTANPSWQYSMWYRSSGALTGAKGSTADRLAAGVRLERVALDWRTRRVSA